MDTFKSLILIAVICISSGCAVENTGPVDSTDATVDVEPTVIGAWISACEKQNDLYSADYLGDPLEQFTIVETGQPLYRKLKLVFWDEGGFEIIGTSYTDQGCTVPYEPSAEWLSDELINPSPSGLYFNYPPAEFWFATELFTPVCDILNNCTQYYPLFFNLQYMFIDNYVMHNFSFVSYMLGDTFTTDDGTIAQKVNLETTSGHLYQTIFTLIDGGQTLLMGDANAGESFLFCLQEEDIHIALGGYPDDVEPIEFIVDIMYSPPWSDISDWLALSYSGLLLRGGDFSLDVYTSEIGVDFPGLVYDELYTCGLRPSKLDYDRVFTRQAGL